MTDIDPKLVLIGDLADMIRYYFRVHVPDGQIIDPYHMATHLVDKVYAHEIKKSEIT